MRLFLFFLALLIERIYRVATWNVKKSGSNAVSELMKIYFDGVSMIFRADEILASVFVVSLAASVDYLCLLI